jgi:hypothetical protein
MDTNPLMEREDALGVLINRDALDEVRERAKVEGQLAGARHFCRQAVRTWHPRAGRKVCTAIDESGDLAALEEVTLHAAQWSLEEIKQRLMNQHGWLTPTRLRLQDSFIYKEGFAEGYAIGRLNTVRNLCRAVVHHWHPRAGKKVWSAIWSSSDVMALQEVTLHAADWSPRDILRRLTGR